MKAHLLKTAMILITILLPATTFAQLAGHNAKGDMGMFSGTQAPPGFIMVPMYYGYSADTARDKHGDRFEPLGGDGEITAGAGIIGLIWVSEKKFLGGNYGASIWPSITRNALKLPALDTNAKSGTGLGDTYIQPINIGWNTDRADFIAGLGIYAPTGSYDIKSDANRGLGMWSYEVYGGTTVYFDKAKSWSFAAFGAYETHGHTQGTNIRVGDIFTLEGGFGKSFMDGAMSVGLAYVGQWKISNDDFGLDFKPPGGPILGKNRVYGFGPEVTLPVASKNTLFGFLNIRYLWETGARTSLEGNTLAVSFSLPVPSIPLQ